MDTLNELAAALASHNLLLCLQAVAKPLAIWAALMFSGVTFGVWVMMPSIFSALEPQYTTPSNYAMLFRLSARVANPFAIVSGLLSALIVLLSHDNDEKLYWTAALIFTAVLLAHFSSRGTAGIIDGVEEEDDDKTLSVDDGIGDGVAIKRQLMRWERKAGFRSFFAMALGLLMMFFVPMPQPA